ncbi:MAG: hypothetical protein SGARI_003669 [Bacillariaceae sp.]
MTLVSEPGRYFVEAAAVLASRIYQKQTIVTSCDGDDKENGECVRIYKIPHGVQGVFKDAILCNEVFVPQPMITTAATKNNNVTENTKLFPSKIIGPSGDDEDVVCPHCLLPEMNVGDWLIFDRMGAYTISIASRAGRPVMRYVCGGGETAA